MSNQKKYLKRIRVLLLAIALTVGSVMSMEKMLTFETQAASTTSKKLNAKVKKIVNKEVGKNDPETVKLQKLFTYAQTFDYARAPRGFTNSKAKKNKKWIQTYALNMYNKKKGSCYHYAAAYAYLAKKATDYPTYVVIGKTNGFQKERTQEHAWVEIKIQNNWYIFDPNMDKFAENCSGKYFMASKNEMKETYNNFKKVKRFKI